MHSLTIFLVCLVASLALSKSIPSSECGVTCEIFCEYGNVLDNKGCPTCMCKQAPCPDGRDSLAGYYCGRSPNRRECPSSHYCLIAPDDSYAKCCPQT